MHAQDTRTVTEPKIPPACVRLDANIVSTNGQIALADEQKLSTARIQDALDHCSAGHAVVLRARGRRNVFLTGPLTLRPDVTFVVSKNTALVASRDPRVFDLAPGGCGIVSTRGRGCKPLISADGAKNAGIMGEGSIDARGGADLLGQDVDLVGPRARGESQRRETKRSLDDRFAPRRQFHPVQDHAAQLAGLSRLRQPD